MKRIILPLLAGMRLMKVLDILRENGIEPPDLSVLPQDRSVDGGYGNRIDEQAYTLIVKGEVFPDRRKKDENNKRNRCGTCAQSAAFRLRRREQCGGKQA